MVARLGNAPRSTGCEPAALLLSYRALKFGGTPRTRTLDTFKGCCCFQDSFLDQPGAFLLSKWLSDVDSHHDEPINSRPCYFDIIGDLVLPAGIAPALFRLEYGCLWSTRPRELC